MFQTIECAQLNLENTEFCMSYPLASDRVTASVGAVGVLHPIIVSGCPCEGGYQVVTGFRRAHACRQLGLKWVNAYIHRVDPDNKLAMFHLILSENASHRTFNAVEKSLIVHKLLNQFGCDRQTILTTYLPMLGLAAHGRVLDAYLPACAFDAPMQAYLAEHDVPMGELDLFNTLSVEDRRAVFALIISLKLGVNKIKDLLALLDEIALREQRPIHSILTDERIQALLHQEQTPTPQKADLVRRYLWEQRYPEFTKLEQAYQQAVKDLHVPTGVRLSTDRFFEDDRMAVEFRFRTPDELRQAAEGLVDLAGKSELQRLLDVIQGVETSEVSKTSEV